MEANLQASQPPTLQESVQGAREILPIARMKLQVRSILQWLRPIGFGGCALVLLFMLAGLSYQFTKLKADGRRFPQEGRSVDIGGYKLNINCAGQGSPTVILEAGLAVPAPSWRTTQAGIAKFTRVCWYDRAGYGWSDPGPMPRTTSQIVTELHRLLQNSGERPPYILVGHSTGGPIVRIYAFRYAGQVAGLVLVDPGHEDLKFSDNVQKIADGELRQRQRDRQLGPILYWLGISRFAARNVIDNSSPSDPEPEFRYFAIQPKFITTAANETENLTEGKDELRAAGSLGDKPLVVLIGENSLLNLPVSPEEKAEANLSWIEFEKRLADLSSRGKWVIVPGAGHMLPFERPDAIVSAVRGLWTGAKAQ